MYSVQRLGKRYALVIPKGGGKRHRIRLTATDRASAEAEARSVFAGIRDEPWTVGRIVNEYIAARESAEIASTSRQKDAWKAMKGFWENVDPERIDEAMCRKYAEVRRVGPATLRYELSAGGMMLAALRALARTDLSAPSSMRTVFVEQMLAEMERERPTRMSFRAEDTPPELMADLRAADYSHLPA